MSNIHTYNMELADKLDVMAKRHYDPDTRHIGKEDYDLLMEVKAALLGSSFKASKYDDAKEAFALLRNVLS